MGASSLAACLRELGLTGYAEALRGSWDDSQASLPAEVLFLRDDSVREACRRTWLSGDLAGQVLAAARTMREDPCLRALAWHCHHRSFVAEAGHPEVSAWPLPDGAMGDLAGLFYVVVVLSGTEFRERVHRQRGIPLAVVRETVSDLEICIRTERHAALGGPPGISPHIFGWLLRHWRGRLYRLGRLQFAFGRFSGKVRAFRNVESGVVVALSDHGSRFRADGQVMDTEGAWTATWRKQDDEIIGFPISPRGFAVKQEVRLPASRWRQVLAPGDPILEVHIPAGPPMAFDACGESFRRALDFFPRHVPDEPFRAFVCASWILDTQIDGLMPPDSNLVRFQREMYLFPIPSGGDMPWQVRMADGQTQPRTRMQRAFYEHVARGGRFHSGGCFLLADDLRWGEQVYRSQPLPGAWLG